MELVYLTPWAIVVETLGRFLPVWIAMALIMGASFVWRGRLGTYGRIYDSPIAMIGFGLVLFWLLTAIMADWVALFDPYQQIRALQNKSPGAIDPESGLAYLFGGDALGRDVFSRMVYGSRTVMAIAPLATLFAYMIGITLGLPAGYVGGWFDTVLSFVANLVLAFPVILLFYLLVTPEIRETAIPSTMAAVFFIFPVLFVTVFLWSRFRERPEVLWFYLAPVILIGGFAYLGLTGLWDSDRAARHGLQYAQHLPGGGVHHLPHRLPDRARADARHQDAGLRGGGADPRRAAVVHHDVGDPAERPRAADRGCLPADRVFHHPPRHAGVLRAGGEPGKPGLGVDDQRGAQAAADIRPPCPAAGAWRS